MKELYFKEKAKPRQIALAVDLPIESVRAILARCRYLIKTSERRKVEDMRPGPKGYDRVQVCDLLQKTLEETGVHKLTLDHLRRALEED